MAKQTGIFLAVFTFIFSLNVGAQERTPEWPLQAPDYSDWAFVQSGAFGLSKESHDLKLVVSANVQSPYPEFVLVWSDREDSERFLSHLRITAQGDAVLMEVRYFFKIEDSWKLCEEEGKPNPSDCVEAKSSFETDTIGRDNFLTISNKMIYEIYKLVFK